MKRDRSEMGRALASIDQQIGELQRARQILLDARGPQREQSNVLVGYDAGFTSPIPTNAEKRRRRTKAEMKAAAEAAPN